MADQNNKPVPALSLAIMALHPSDQKRMGLVGEQCYKLGHRDARHAAADLVLEYFDSNPAATPAVPVPALTDELLRIGQGMSNVFYNMSQRVGHTLTDEDSANLKSLQEKWDAAYAKRPRNASQSVPAPDVGGLIPEQQASCDAALRAAPAGQHGSVFAAIPEGLTPILLADAACCIEFPLGVATSKKRAVIKELVAIATAMQRADAHARSRAEGGNTQPDSSTGGAQVVKPVTEYFAVEDGEAFVHPTYGSGTFFTDDCKRAAEGAATSERKPMTEYGPDNPPRLRKQGESVEEYRVAMGWDQPKRSTPEEWQPMEDDDILHLAADHGIEGELFGTGDIIDFARKIIERHHDIGSDK